MNYLIVEDIDIQASYIKNIIETTFPNSKCYIASNYDIACDMIMNHHFHIYILDIDLGNGELKSGIELGKKIREMSNNTYVPILFTTSLPEKMQDAINVIHCYSYLVKPYSKESLINAISSLNGSSLIPEEKFSFREPGGVHFHITPSEIKYVEIYNHTLKLHTEITSFSTNDYTIKEFCSLFPHMLIQCHKSYAFNVNNPVKISTNYVSIYINGKTISIPLGRSYKEAIRERFK